MLILYLCPFWPYMIDIMRYKKKVLPLLCFVFFQYCYLDVLGVKSVCHNGSSFSAPMYACFWFFLSFCSFYGFVSSSVKMWKWFIFFLFDVLKHYQYQKIWLFQIAHIWYKKKKKKTWKKNHDLSGFFNGDGYMRAIYLYEAVGAHYFLKLPLLPSNVATFYSNKQTTRHLIGESLKWQ